MRRARLYMAYRGALILVIGLVTLSATAHAQTAGDSYITFHGDLARTGWNAGETQLTQSAIDNRMPGQGRLGKLWEYRFIHGDPGIPEQVYATPLYYKGMVFAASREGNRALPGTGLRCRTLWYGMSAWAKALMKSRRNTT